MSGQISLENVDELVLAAFTNVRQAVEDGSRPLSSEHTLRLLFTWELGRLLGYDPSYTFDLEWQGFADLDGKDTFLDLVVWTDPEFKLAVEFKLPKRSPRGKNSPVTNTRAKICRDVSRLSYLVRNRANGIRLGYFLAAVNEPTYLIEGRKKVNPHYRVFQGAHYEPGVVLEPGVGSNGVHRPLPFPDHPIEFRWEGATISPNTGRATITGRFAWLSPIRVSG
ncbi:MAG: hypothetical protein JKY65_25990 [Planctomycetes bacterium]|nr:hypothetical protein [Planctomycetota bacterium]